MAFIGIEKTVWDALKPNKKARLCRMPENIDLMAESQIDSPTHHVPEWHDDGTHYYVFCNPELTERDAKRMAKFLDKADDKEPVEMIEAMADGPEIVRAEVVSPETVDMDALDAIALPTVPAVIFSSEIPPEGWEPNGKL